MLRGTEKGRFSPMTFFAWLAIAVGIWAMSSFLSVMYGFESSLRERVLKAFPHVMVSNQQGSQPIQGYEPWTERLKNVDGVDRVLQYVEAEMIVQSPRRTLGGVVWGIAEKDLARLSPDVTEGSVPKTGSETLQVLMGQELADRLGVFIGDEIRLISPTKSTGAMGMVPRSEVFNVVGFYQSGHYEFDQAYLFVVMQDAQDLLKWKNAISGWHIWGTDIDDADELEMRISQLLPPELKAQSWTKFNAALFSSLKLEQYSMFVILSLAILIAVMNIVITLMMHVTQKQRNIGVLRALGASKRQIQRIFIWQGAALGGVGLVIGAVLTVLFMVYLRYFSGYLLPEIYYDRSVPVEVRPLSIVLIYLVAIVFIFLATIYPSKKAASLHPIEAIKS